MTAAASRFGRPVEAGVTRVTPPSRLWGSNGVAFGPDGRLHVAQFLGGRISAVDLASGDVEVVVPVDGPVRAPDDLAFGADGSMYIADLVPGKVWRRTPAGEFSLVSDELIAPNGITCVGDRLFVNEMRPGGRLLELTAAGPALLAEELAWGNAMQLGPDGHLYYPHMMTGQVWRVPVDGGAAELVAEDLPQPVAVRFDRAGTLVVLSSGAAGAVTRIDLDTGSRSTFVTGITGLDNAAFDAGNRMFASSFASGGIAEVRVDGRFQEVVPRGFNGPFGVAVDRGGAVHVADHFSLARLGEEVTRELLVFSRGVATEAELLHLTTGRGEVRSHDPATGTNRVRATDLREPTGIAVAPDGALVVAETGAGRVLRIDPSDAVSVLAEGLGEPVDVALDADGRCYAADGATGAVLRLDAEPVVVADGLDVPHGLVVRGGELVVVETGRRRLRAIPLDGGPARTVVEDLPVGPPPGTTPPEPDPSSGVTMQPRAFAGLALDPSGDLLVAADGEGSVLRVPR
ncbi:hypothetical protein [Saccharopolyspora sp. CA-218241]|uniref:hypothetical protein n=1 Tax=Saccharopolyspora sp. CA-218241 TaxID=3240027 RepID=UPI003D9934D5